MMDNEKLTNLLIRQTEFNGDLVGMLITIMDKTGPYEPAVVEELKALNQKSKQVFKSFLDLIDHPAAGA